MKPGRKECCLEQGSMRTRSDMIQGSNLSPKAVSHDEPQSYQRIVAA